MTDSPVLATQSVMPTDKTIEAAKPPTLAELAALWLKIGVLSFGGPAAQMALMHRLVVDEKRWLSEQQYVNALGFCLLLPGPEAMQLATYSGWRLHGTRGGLIAGGLFVLPGALLMAVLAFLYVRYGEWSGIAAVFIGIKAAVVVIVIQALLRVASKALTTPLHWLVAVASFIGIFVMGLPFAWIVLGAGLFGFLRSSQSAATGATRGAPQARLLQATARTLGVWGGLWLLPLGFLWLNDSRFLWQLGALFSQLAVVSFGGAYAVLAYLAQAAVTDYAWLGASDMMDGLGLAETTPGPLILVNEFVAFLAGYQQGGVALALAAAALCLWVTFVPCFLWIFAGAPYLEWISDQPRLRGALSMITAAVVGVILNLSLWFSLHVWFSKVQRVQFAWIDSWWPILTSMNVTAVALSALSAFVVFRLRWGVLGTLALAAGLATGVAFAC